MLFSENTASLADKPLSYKSVSKSVSIRFEFQLTVRSAHRPVRNPPDGYKIRTRIFTLFCLTPRKASFFAIETSTEHVSRITILQTRRAAKSCGVAEAVKPVIATYQYQYLPDQFTLPITVGSVSLVKAFTGARHWSGRMNKYVIKESACYATHREAPEL